MKQNIKNVIAIGIAIKGKLYFGMATPDQITDVQIEIKFLQDDIAAKENLLNDSKDYFKVLIDLD